MRRRRLITITFILALVGLFSMGLNARQAASMRDAILAKDQTGNDVTLDVLQLGHYVGAHMNSSISFELKASYQRAVEKAQQAAVPDVSATVYAQADAACAGKKDSITQANCRRDYVATHLKPVASQPITLPDEKLYRNSFTTPAWTPDLAGLTLLGAAACAVWTVFKAF